jgi:predicted Zn-dependent protease
VVVDTRVPNAVSAPYGYVLITTGALDMVQSEAELAFILAHEIVHVEGKHGLAHLVRAYFDVAKRAARERLDSMSRPLPAKAQARRDELERRMDELSDLALKGYGFSDELEADRGALELLSRAGYDPSAGISVLERLAEAHAGRSDDAPQIFRSHPSPGERIDAARRVVARLPKGGVRAEARFEAAVR